MRKEIITRDSKNVKQMGRILYHDGICYLTYSASEIGFYYDGDRIVGDFVTDDWCEKEPDREAWIGVFVGDDEEPFCRIPLKEYEKEYVLFDRAEYASVKKISPEKLDKALAIRIVKYSEIAFGAAGLRYLLVDDDAKLCPLPEKNIKIEFIGDSITCGYGIEGEWNVDVFKTSNENPFRDYALLTSKALNADYQLVSWSGIGLISDWIPPEVDEPDETILMPQIYPYTAYTASERLNAEKEPWDAKRFTPDYVVIHLGTNDDSYTREKPEREAAFIKAYRKLYNKVRENYGDVEIVCCLGLMARTLCPVLAKLVKKLQEEGDSHIHWVEFEGQLESDGIAVDWHPSAVTHRKAAQVLTQYLKNLK